MATRWDPSRLASVAPSGHAGASKSEAMNWRDTDDLPAGQLTLRTLAMPADANAAGDIFGGWVMAQMDLACGIRAAERARGRVVTAAVREMSFASPMKIGDTLCIYTRRGEGRPHLDDAEGRGLGAALSAEPDGEGDRRGVRDGRSRCRGPSDAGAARP